jgi:Ni/Co efflux regulator RcnB
VPPPVTIVTLPSTLNTSFKSPALPQRLLSRRTVQERRRREFSSDLAQAARNDQTRLASRIDSSSPFARYHHWVRGT